MQHFYSPQQKVAVFSSFFCWGGVVPFIAFANTKMKYRKSFNTRRAFSGIFFEKADIFNKEQKEELSNIEKILSKFIKVTCFHYLPKSGRFRPIASRGTQKLNNSVEPYKKEKCYTPIRANLNTTRVYFSFKFLKNRITNVYNQ